MAREPGGITPTESLSKFRRAPQTFLCRLLGRLNPARHPRANPRVIKRKYVKWHVKRAHHAHWPRPAEHSTYQIIGPN